MVKDESNDGSLGSDLKIEVTLGLITGSGVNAMILEDSTLTQGSGVEHKVPSCESLTMDSMNRL